MSEQRMGTSAISLAGSPGRGSTVWQLFARILHYLITGEKIPRIKDREIDMIECGMAAIACVVLQGPEYSLQQRLETLSLISQLKHTSSMEALGEVVQDEEAEFELRLLSLRVYHGFYVKPEICPMINQMIRELTANVKNKEILAEAKRLLPILD